MMAYIRGMADNEHQHVPTREVVGLAPVDPLIAFYWARLDDEERELRETAAAGARDNAWMRDVEDLKDEAPTGEPSKRGMDDLAAKRAILDDYAGYCADVDNPGRELICQVARDVIKRLATVHAGHPDYDPAWRP